jgi:dihydroflavonol-4-reductase
MPDIALTGTSGHLGMVVQKMLVSDGISHRVLLRRPVDYIHSGDIVYGDLEDGSVRRALLEQSQTVIHCAAKVWPRTGRNASVIHTNYELTRALFEDAVQAGVQHFIYISSIHSMVAPPPDSVFDESAGLSEDPNRPYDFSKAESERFLRRRTEMRVTIINPTAIIGPGDHYFRGMNQLFTRLYRGRLPAVTAGGFNIVDVRDAARAILTTAVKQQEGKYILTGSYYEILELARKYADLTGRKVPSLIIRPGWMRFWRAYPCRSTVWPPSHLP